MTTPPPVLAMLEETPEQIAGLLALAERCEAASGPDRELDCAIYDAFYPRIGQAFKCGTGYLASVYTASLDAAKSIAPKGLGWEAGETDDGKGYARVITRTGPVKSHWSRDAATPALALCAAALRAHAAALTPQVAA